MKRIVVVLAALALLAACEVQLITAPDDGAIVPDDTVVVTGTIPESIQLGGELRVNDIPTPVNPDRTWSQTIPIDTERYVTEVRVDYVAPNGVEWRDRRAVVHGPRLDEGQYSSDGVGMRFTNTGLASLGPIIQDLASGAFDISGLLLAQDPLFFQENALLTIDATGRAYEAGIGGVGLAASSTTAGVATDIEIDDLYVGVDMHLTDGLLININCRLELQIPHTSIHATFDLEPMASNPSFVDVNLVGSPTVATSAVNYEFISGICDGDTFLIGDIVNLVAGPQIQSLVAGGFAQNLGDPDGSGPLDSPIADAIETALAEISIAGSVGEAVHANLDAPFTLIDEGADAIDFRANADFFSTFGTGPTDCQPAPFAPDLDATFDVPGAYPTLGATTPGGDPYGLGLVISASTFNQLLGAMTECGVLNQQLTEIPFGGVTLPVTSSVLAAIVPEFGTAVAPNTPMEIRVKPTAAPFISERPGPNGEPAELVLPNLHVEFVQPNWVTNVDLTWLTLAIDAPLGFDLAYDEVNGVLAPSISAPAPADVTARVRTNLIGTNEAFVEALFPSLFPSFVSALSDTFGAFPLPAFLGLQLDVLDVVRDGNYFVLYGNLNQIPQTRIANVQLTDLSTGDSVVDSIFDVNEWRHRIRRSVTPSEIGVDLKAMIGADACCTVDDESKSAHAGYRLTFDVIPENGESWRLDIAHSIAGAHTLKDERVLLEDGGGETRFTTPISGRVRIGDGPWQNFNFNPSVTSVVHQLYGGEGDSYAPFTGQNSTVITGSTAQTITIEFGFDVFAWSNSNVLFPAAGGDEVAIRIGANDTIVNGFTAGEYPGVGNRNILTDGHKALIRLTALP